MTNWASQPGAISANPQAFLFDGPAAALPDVAPGESLRLTRTETGWEVRRLRWTRIDLEDPTATRWADAPEQDGDR